MATRSLNKVQLIGNLTRDPELRYTPAGTAVSTFGVATNRSWTTDTGEKHEEAEFHTIVVWNKLAEICSQFLAKGRQVYIEGRLATREWEAQDGTKRRTTEVVANEVIFLGGGGPPREELEVPADLGVTETQVKPTEPVSPGASRGGQTEPEVTQEEPKTEEPAAVEPAETDDKKKGDIPF